MKTLILVLALVATWAAPAQAAIAVVQTASTFGNNNPVLTFGSAMGASNHILVAATVGSTAVSVDLTGITATETVLHGPVNHGTSRVYAWCFQGDGSDTTVTLGGAGANIRAIGIEISGGSCTEDGTSSSNSVASTTSHALTTDVTLAAGSILFGIVTATDANADFTAGAGVTSVPAGNTEIESISLGGYRIEASGAAYDLPFTSTVNRDTIMVGAAVQAAGGGGGGGSTSRLMLLGCCEW